MKDIFDFDIDPGPPLESDNINEILQSNVTADEIQAAIHERYLRLKEVASLPVPPQFDRDQAARVLGDLNSALVHIEAAFGARASWATTSNNSPAKPQSF